MGVGRVPLLPHARDGLGVLARALLAPAEADVATLLERGLLDGELGGERGQVAERVPCLDGERDGARRLLDLHAPEPAPGPIHGIQGHPRLHRLPRVVPQLGPRHRLHQGLVGPHPERPGAPLRRRERAGRDLEQRRRRVERGLDLGGGPVREQGPVLGHEHEGVCTILDRLG